MPLCCMLNHASHIRCWFVRGNLYRLATSYFFLKRNEIKNQDCIYPSRISSCQLSTDISHLTISNNFKCDSFQEFYSIVANKNRSWVGFPVIISIVIIINVHTCSEWMDKLIMIVRRLGLSNSKFMLRMRNFIHN